MLWRIVHNTYWAIRWIFVLLLSLLVPLSYAKPVEEQLAAHSVQTQSALVRLVAWAPEGIAKGKPFHLGLRIKHQPGWHVYWKNPGQAGFATTFQWQLPKFLQPQKIMWATPQVIKLGGLVNYGYSHDVLLAVPVHVTDDVAANAKLDISLDAQWLACKTNCVPQQAKLKLELKGNQPIQSDAHLFKQFQASTPKNLPGAQMQVVIQDKKATITATNLPASWRGKKLNFYPETEQIFATNIDAKQIWQGNTWQLHLPLDAQRRTEPKEIAAVLALRADAALNTQHIIANAPDQPGYRLTAAVQGSWSSVAPVENSSTAPSTMPHQASASFGFSILLAFLGGLILNLMPCVFPILAIKVLSFARHSNSPYELRLTALTYTAGVVLSLLLMAGILLALRAGGAALGWGFQLQNPYIVSALGLLFVVLGFNFLGWFEIPALPLPASFSQQHNPAIEAFLSGILTVLVATPCSAPFVGTALAAALVLPSMHALLLFACMGLGLSLPVLIASFYPKLLALLPKPGSWMELLRQIMSFFMFATAIWLAWVLGKQAGVDAIAIFLFISLLLAGVFWAWNTQGSKRKWLVVIFAVLFLSFLGLGVLHLQSNKHEAKISNGIWQPWSKQRLQQALKNKRVVFVDYTAAWCITCQFNKQTVLERAPFKQWARDNKVLLLRADWTNKDPVVTESLQSLGRVSVPTYALYNPNISNKPKVLGEIISLDKIKKALP